MEYIYRPPPLPSVSRWRALYREHPGASCLRALEYERLRKLPLSGKVLDVGGGEKMEYRSLLPGEIIYHSVNIDPAASPTFLLKPCEPFPIEVNTYDACLCLATLEHVYDARFVLEQICRVLRVGGAVIIVVPFIYRIHGHPDDFFRATPSWWRETLCRVGFSQCELQPLLWGRNTTAASFRSSRGLFRRAQFHLAHLTDLAYSWVALRSGNGHYAGVRGERICATALGYFIIARK